MKTNNLDHRIVNNDSISNLVSTLKRKTYVTVAAKGTLALIGRSEESRRNLEKHQNRNRI
jgi:hypothetical protein